MKNIAMLIKVLILVCFISLSGSLCLYGEGKNLSLTQAEKDWLKKHPVITLAVDDTYTPKNYRNAAGNMAGISIDYMNLLAEKLNINIEFEGSVWEKALDNALKHKVDGIINADELEARKQSLSFTEIYTSYPQAVVTKKEFYGEGNFFTFKGKKIAVKKNTSQENLLLESYPLISVVSVETVLDGLKLLQEDKVDAVFDDVSVLLYHIEENYFDNLKIFFLHYDDIIGKCRIGLRNNDPILLSVFNKAIKNISENERRFIQKKWTYFNPKDELYNSIEFSEEEKIWLKNHPNIKVGVESNWAPVEYAGTDGSVKGIVSEYLTLLESVLGVTFYITNDVPWHELMRLARIKKIDMLSGVAVTEDRKEFLEFSDNYIEVPIVVFANENVSYIGNLNDLNGKKVAVGKNFAPHGFLKQNYPKIDLVLCDTLPEGIEKLSRKEVFALVDGILSISYYMKELKITNIKVAGNTPYKYKIAMGVRKDWKIFVDLINRVIRNIPETTKDSFYHKWAPISYIYKEHLFSLWKIAIPIFLFAIFFIYWNRKFSLEIKKRRLVEEKLEKAKNDFENVSSSFEEKISARTYELENTANALLSREKMYRQLFEGSKDGIVYCNLLGVIKDANQSFLDMLGYSLEELKKMTFYDITPEKWHAEEKEHTEYVMLSSGKSINYEKEYRRKDGTVFPVEMSVYKYEGDEGKTVFLWGVVRDIAERKKAEQELKKNAATFEVIFNQTFHLIGLLSPEGEIVKVNQTILDFLKKDKESVIAKKIWNVEFWQSGKEMELWLQECIEKSSNGESIRFQSTQFGYPEDKKYIDYSVTPLFNDKKEVIFLLFEGRDITELKNAQDKTIQQERKLIQANRLSALGTMIASIAHEINNPVNFISINTELLEEYIKKLNPLLTDQNLEKYLNFSKERFDKNVEEIFSALIEGSQRIKKIISDLKEFSQYRSVTVYSAFDLKEIIQKAYSIVYGSIKGKVKKIELDIAENIPKIQGDHLKIEQVVVNMINNASTALANRKDSFLKIKAFLLNSDTVRIVFSDNGCGISVDNLHNIFEPFVTTRQGCGGTGLGLSVSYGIVQEHNGNIIVYSKKDNGTCFTIDLPVGEKAVSVIDPKILLVDDKYNETKISTLNKIFKPSEIIKIHNRLPVDEYREALLLNSECDVVVSDSDNAALCNALEKLIEIEFPWVTYITLVSERINDVSNVVVLKNIGSIIEKIKSIRESY